MDSSLAIGLILVVWIWWLNCKTWLLRRELDRLNSRLDTEIFTQSDHRLTQIKEFNDLKLTQATLRQSVVTGSLSVEVQRLRINKLNELQSSVKQSIGYLERCVNELRYDLDGTEENK